MRIKYYTKSHDRIKDEPTEIDIQNLYIVLCDGHTIEIHQDQHNDTNIHSTDGTLVIRPDASNWIKIGVQRI